MNCISMLSQKRLCVWQLVRNNFISTVSMMYRRSALECLDYVFDDEFTFIQDYDLSPELHINMKLIILMNTRKIKKT